jgi:hypothetical protein
MRGGGARIGGIGDFLRVEDLRFESVDGLE